MKLIKINTDHYIIVDDSEIKEGDWVYQPMTNAVYKTSRTDNSDIGYKITHSTQPLESLKIDSSVANIQKVSWGNIKYLPFQEVKELLGEVDVEKKAEKFIGCEYEDIEDNIDQIGYDSFIRGYNQAIEDNKDKKYTEEDLRKAIEMARDIKDDSAHDIFTAEDVSGCTEVCTYGWRNRYEDEEIIQSLQPKTEWEVEFVDGKFKLK